jgi:hypothetical protein
VAAVDHAYGGQGPCSVRAEARGQGVQCRSPGQRLFDRRATVGRRAIRNPNIKEAFALPKGSSDALYSAQFEYGPEYEQHEPWIGEKAVLLGF